MWSVASIINGYSKSRERWKSTLPFNIKNLSNCLFNIGYDLFIETAKHYINMDSTNKITIKQAINFFPEEAKALLLRNGTPELDKAITKFAEVTGLQEVFIRLNIDLIRNWL